MKGSCHCGAVTVTVPGPPTYLNQCNCTLCFKLGALWGYYPAAEVEIAGAPAAYRRVDSDPPMLNAHFCASCGATTHWSPTEHRVLDRLGINMRLFEPEALDGLEVRYGDRRNYGSGDARHDYGAPTIFSGGPVL